MASPAPERKSTLAHVLCIVWLAIAIILVVNSSICLALWHLGGFKSRVAAFSGHGPVEMFRYYGDLAATQLGGGLVLLAGSVAGLRHKAYGRTLLQVGCVCGTLFLLAFDVLWLRSFLVSPPAGFEGPPRIVFAMAGVVGSLVFMAVPVATLWLLNRSDVRNYFQRPSFAAFYEGPPVK